MTAAAPHPIPLWQSGDEKRMPCSRGPHAARSSAGLQLPDVPALPMGWMSRSRRSSAAGLKDQTLRLRPRILAASLAAAWARSNVRSGLIAQGRDQLGVRRPHLQDHEPVLVVHGAMSFGGIGVAGARLRRAAILLALIGRKLQTARRQIHALLGDRIEDVSADRVD